MLVPGDAAPNFDLPSNLGGSLSLVSLRGRKVVLYFYPKDNTPGCTQEACDFRDALRRIKSVGAEVVGISKDSLASHQRFAEKHSLPYALLADSDNAVAKRYGAFGTKKMYGREVVGSIRSTFVIDEKGKLLAVFSPVRVAGHVEAVLAALGAHGPSTEAPTRSNKKKASTKKAAGATKKSATKGRRRATARAPKAR